MHDDARWFGAHRPTSIARAGFWSALQINTGSVIQIASAIIMARLLPPADFGTVAIVMVVYNLLSGLTSIAFANAVVQRSSITKAEASNMFWCNFLIASGLGSILAAAAPLIAIIYGNPALKHIGLVYGIMVILDGSSVVHQALLRRALRFKFFFISGIICSPVGLAIGVWLALNGAGVYALLAQPVIACILNRIAMFAYIGWIPDSYDYGTKIRSMVTFGAKSAAVMFVDFFYKQGQLFVLGRTADLTAAGYYSRGQALFQRPFAQIMGPMAQILLPALASRQNDSDATTRFIIRGTWWLGGALIPLAVFVARYSVDVAVFALGQEWEGAGEAMRWFAVGSIPWILTCVTFKAVDAKGMPGKTLAIRIFMLPLLVIGSIVLAPHGVGAVVSLYAILEWLAVVPSFWIVLKALDVTRRSIIREIFLIFGCGLAAGIGVSTIHAGFQEELRGISSGFCLLVCMAVSYALFIIAALFTKTGRKEVLGAPQLLREAILPRKKTP